MTDEPPEDPAMVQIDAGAVSPEDLASVISAWLREPKAPQAAAEPKSDPEG